MSTTKRSSPKRSSPKRSSAAKRAVLSRKRKAAYALAALATLGGAGLAYKHREGIQARSGVAYAKLYTKLFAKKK